MKGTGERRPADGRQRRTVWRVCGALASRFKDAYVWRRVELPA